MSSSKDGDSIPDEDRKIAASFVLDENDVVGDDTMMDEDVRSPVQEGLSKEESSSSQGPKTAGAFRMIGSEIQTGEERDEVDDDAHVEVGRTDGQYDLHHHEQRSSSFSVEDIVQAHLVVDEKDNMPGQDGRYVVENVLVDEPGINHSPTIVEATPIANNSQEDVSLHKDKTLFIIPRRKFILLLMGFLLVAVALGVGLGFKAFNDDDDVPRVSTPGSSEDDSVGNTKETFVRDVLPDYTKEALLYNTSDQSLALNWLWSDSRTAELPLFRRIQRFALACLFFSSTELTPDLVGDANGWLSHDVHECEWAQQAAPSVVCRDGRYLTMDQSSNQDIVGSIAPEIGLLTDLIAIQLSDTSYGSSLPTTIGLLTSLEQFITENTNLSGSLPTEIGLVSSLVAFIVSGTSLSSTIPSEIGNLIQLTELIIEGSLLSGPVPSEIGRFENMNCLYVTNSEFMNGQLPTEVGQLSLLSSLALSHTSLSGTIPTELGLLSSHLRYMSLDHTNLSGSIPVELNQLTSLENLELHGSAQLTGDFPLCSLATEGWQHLLTYTISCDVLLRCNCNCTCAK